MNSSRFLTTGLLTSLLLAGSVSAIAADNTSAPASDAAAKKDAEYTQVLEKRTAPMVAALELGDSTKATRVQQRIIAQYKTLAAWQESNEARLKELKKSKDTEAAKPEIAAIYAKRREITDAFLADLAKDLTPAQVDIVKDKITVNKLQVTYGAYLQQNPTLTEEQKKQIHTWLTEARDEAVSGTSMDEKSEIFGKYKGRINNYLSKQGHDLKKADVEWKARRDAEKK
ncbi:MAG: DUF3826 domain-containing protein [Nibricoccus sp.]